MTLDRNALRQAGEALYGPSWQTPLADDLDVALRTVQRWASGERGIPEGLAHDLAVICQRRGRDLAQMAEKLERA